MFRSEDGRWVEYTGQGDSSKRGGRCDFHLIDVWHLA